MTLGKLLASVAIGPVILVLPRHRFGQVHASHIHISQSLSLSSKSSFFASQNSVF